jgi:hypothetical protein
MPQTVSFETNNILSANKNAVLQSNPAVMQGNHDLLMALAAMLGIAA